MADCFKYYKGRNYGSDKMSSSLSNITPKGENFNLKDFEAEEIILTELQSENQEKS